MTVPLWVLILLGFLAMIGVLAFVLLASLTKVFNNLFKAFTDPFGKNWPS